MKHFEILNKLNELDTKNGTAFVGICPDVISVDKKGNNGEVKIGIPGNVAQELVLSNIEGKSLQLLIIDIKEYNSIKNGDDTFFVDSLPQAVHVLSYNLRCDEGYRETWQANIAMAFQDAYKEYFSPLTEDSGEVHEDLQIHHIANNAATHFLNSLVSTQVSNS